ncbi:MAG: NusG domain II-containing protein [Lachnospiraceae bacterium]|nr:NusG domain II-containing protein [Lachnospiraceae bacterium]
MKQRFGKNDWILLCVLAVIGVGMWGYSTFIEKPSATKAVVTVDGKEYGTYNLNKDQTIKIKQKTTVTNVLVIADGEIFMQDATCPDKLCEKQGKIRHDKETIVCLPNKVVVTVVSDEATGIDSVAN